MRKTAPYYSLLAGLLLVAAFGVFGVLLTKAALQMYIGEYTSWEEAQSQGEVGLGVLILALILIWPFLRKFRKERRTYLLQQRYPDKPWMWRDDWAAGSIRSPMPPVLLVRLVIRVILMAIVYIILAVCIYRSFRDPNYRVPILVIGAAIAVSLFFLAAVRKIVLWTKFGNWDLRLHSTPVIIGEMLEGLIHTNITESVLKAIEITLACMDRTLRRSVVSKYAVDNIIWQQEDSVGADRILYDRNGMVIPVNFHIPIECKQTSVADTRTGIRWLLYVKMSFTSGTIVTDFEIPVFKTE